MVPIRSRLKEVIDNVDDPKIEDYRTELIALRELFHFELLRLYAQLPTSGSTSTLGIVLSTEVYPITYIGERASLTDSYAQVIKDLTTAIDSNKNLEKNAGYMNYWTALAIRARVYLYMEKYTEALVDCKKIIEDSPYELYTIAEYESAWKKVGTNESILEILQTDIYNAQRAALGYQTNLEGYAEAALNDAFFTMLTANPNDICSNMISKRKDVDNDQHEGNYGLKYMGQEGASNWMYANNPKIIRLSEVHFIAAEAELQVGSASLAARYINTVRRNRITGYVDVTTISITDIINERRLELFDEGHIAFDYWRNQIEFTSEFFPSATPYVLPIPQREIDLSRDKLVQNPS